MNTGADAAAAPNLMFLHSDTRLPFVYQHEVYNVLNDADSVAGAFRMTFDVASFSLRLIEWGVHLRSVYRQYPYGDQALFMRREIFDKIGGFDETSEMEDYTLIRRLRRIGRIHISTRPVLTSSRKYSKNGPWRTVVHHQRMLLQWRYHTHK